MLRALQTSSFFILFCSLLFSIRSLSIKKLTDENKIITNEIETADINIAVLSTVREQPTKEICNTKNSAISTRFLQSLYLVKKGINDVNENENILPNITIGYVFIDTCNLVPKTIKHSVELIPRVTDQTCSKSDEEMEYYNVQAVIASISSSESVQLSSLLSRFKIPQISPMSTSDDLSDKVRYEYFTRIVSPDKFQADALTDFVLEFDWNYVSIIYIEGSYGENGAKQLRKLSALKGICIAVDEMISLDNSKDDIKKTVKSIGDYPNAEIIIIFLYPGETKMLYDQLANEQLLDKKYVLASDGMSFIQIPSVLEKRVYNTFGIAFEYKTVPGSFDFLSTLNPLNNPDLLYINNYWSRIFNCTWNKVNNKTKLCDPEANLTESNFQISGDSLEYDCFLVVIKAMNRVVQKFCPGISGSKARNCITGERLLQEIRTGTFNTTIGKVQFDKNGDVYGGYNIVQYTNNGKWNVIGRWSRERKGIILKDPIIWPNSYVPISVCSQPCPPRHYFIQKAVACCWDCRKCRNNEILIDNRTHCKECPQFYWPDDEALVCLSIKPDYLKWSDFETVIIATFGIFGLISASIISIILILKRKEKLIRASSLPLTSIILFAIKLSLLTTFFFLIKPTNTICGVNRYLFSLSNTLIYAPIIMKTNRVYRIFASARKGNQTTKLISNQFQIIMSAVIVLIQIILMVLSTIISGNEASLKQKVRTEDYVELHCNLPLKGFLPCLAYNILLAAISSYYGFLTRKLPENFNEASYIFVSVSTTFFVWLVLLPVYFTTEIAKYQSVLLAATCLLNSLITLVCLFAPKLYALWFIDENDLRFVFTASSNRVSSTTVE